MNKYTEQQQAIRSRSDRNPCNSLSCLWQWSRYVNTQTTVRSSAANLLLISYETPIIFCLLSPIIQKTVNNVPYLLLTHFRGFQDKSPSAIHHSSHMSFPTTLPISIPFLVLLCPFWHGRIKAVSASKMQVHHCGLTQREQDVLFCHACWLLLSFSFHRVHPPSRASLLQITSASFTVKQCASKVKTFHTPLFTQHLSILNLIWIL